MHAIFTVYGVTVWDKLAIIWKVIREPGVTGYVYETAFESPRVESEIVNAGDYGIMFGEKWRETHDYTK